MKRIIPPLPLLAAMPRPPARSRGAAKPRLDLCLAEIVAGRNDSPTVADIACGLYGDSLLPAALHRKRRSTTTAVGCSGIASNACAASTASGAGEPSARTSGQPPRRPRNQRDYADEASSRDPQSSGHQARLELGARPVGNLRWAKRKGGAEYLATVATSASVHDAGGRSGCGLLPADRAFRTTSSRSCGAPRHAPRRSIIRPACGSRGRLTSRDASSNRRRWSTLPLRRSSPIWSAGSRRPKTPFALLMATTPTARWRARRCGPRRRWALRACLSVFLFFGAAPAVPHAGGRAAAAGGGCGRHGLCRPFPQTIFRLTGGFGNDDLAGLFRSPFLCGRHVRRTGSASAANAAYGSGARSLRRSTGALRTEGAGGLQGGRGRRDCLP